MTSKSIRIGLPTNLVVLWKESTTVPDGFIDETATFGHYTTGVPDNCTNPGTICSTSTHSHSAGASHTHTSASSTSHTHSLTTNAGANVPMEIAGCGFPLTGANHTHTATSTSACPTWDTSGSTANPDHTASTLELEHKTVKYIKKTSSVSMRLKTIPYNAFGFWNGDRTLLPDGYSSITSFFGKHLKAVADAGTSPDISSGSNTHQHAAGGAHTHSVSIASHSHSGATTGSASTNVNNSASSTPATSVVLSSHTHTVGTISLTAASDSSTSDSNSIHQHSSNNHEPTHHQLIALQNTSISSRRLGVPIGFIGEWFETLASIPTGFAHSNGTLGTPDLRSKYIKIVPDACTNPGATAGSSTHTHDIAGAHTHPISGFTHTHTTSGITGCGGIHFRFNTGSGQCVASSPHTHTMNSPTGTGSVSGTLDSNGSHCHGIGNNNLSNIQVAYIQKI